MCRRLRHASSRPRADREAAGFTLLELLVVLALLGLVAGVVAPSVGLVGSQGDIRSAVRKVGGAVHEARTLAGRTRMWAELRIVPGSYSKTRDAYSPVVMELTGSDPDGEPMDMGRVELPEGVVLRDVLVETVGEDTGFKPGETVVLRFHPRGLAMPAAVRLTTDQAEATVCVHPVVGVTYLEELASLEQCKREK